MSQMDLKDWYTFVLLQMQVGDACVVLGLVYSLYL